MKKKNDFWTSGYEFVKKINNKEADFSEYAILFLVFFLIIFIIRIIYFYSTYFEKKITIKKKYLRTRGEHGDWYMVVDDTNTIYRINNLLWNFDFNRAEDYNILEPNKTYKIKGYGFRFGLFDMYPIIYEIMEK